ncbi:MAG: SRPBCC family protein [Actinobacteria bacterium]|nr:SRPBCC family protein [Actinomycetota bacterium]
MPDNDAYSEIIPAAQDDIVKALTDFESYPQWQSGVLECAVKERDDEGRGTLVEMYVDAKIKKIRYSVRYFYDLDNGRMGWDYVGGDLQECTGRYQFTAQPDGGTEVAIDIVTEVGFFVPGPMKKLIRDQSLKNSMRDLKKRVA